MGEYLDAFLKKNKKDASTINKKTLNTMIIVENEIVRRKAIIEQAEEALKNNAINIFTISKTTKVSNKTFYNNELLNKFVEENSTHNSDLNDEIKKLKNKIDDSESKITKLVHKDIDDEILKNQIVKLQNELSNAQKRVKSLEEQHEKDMKKLNQTVIHKDKYLA